MKKLPVFCLFFVLFGFASVPLAGADEISHITATELKEKLESGEKLFLLNPLSEIEFNEEHIPGSVNIPLTKIPTSDLLPPDKNQLIITYCLGVK